MYSRGSFCCRRRQCGLRFGQIPPPTASNKPSLFDNILHHHTGWTTTMQTVSAWLMVSTNTHARRFSASVIVSSWPTDCRHTLCSLLTSAPGSYVRMFLVADTWFPAQFSAEANPLPEGKKRSGGNTFAMRSHWHFFISRS